MQAQRALQFLKTLALGLQGTFELAVFTLEDARPARCLAAAAEALPKIAQLYCNSITSRMTPIIPIELSATQS